MNDVPHLALPLSLSGMNEVTRTVAIAFTTNQQGSTDEVAACVAVVCSFPRGSREEAPDFGIEDPEFQLRPIDTSDVQAACETYEPRAVVQVVEAPFDPADPLADGVTIAVSVLQTEDM